MEDKSLPLFDADAAEEYISQLLQKERRLKNEIFNRDNEGRHASELWKSPEYHVLRGRELALMDVLEYFLQFDLGTPNA